MIVAGQRVAEDKTVRARELRRDMTPAERVLWNRLRRGQLNGLHFRRQQVIDGFIADFYCHALGLVVEVDGSVHDTQREADAERDQIFAARELTVLRLPNALVLSNPDAAVARILSEGTRP